MINDGLQSTDFDIDSFLMIGQSNMAGRGELYGTPGITNPECFMQRNGRWQPMCEPINVDRPIFMGEFRSGASLAASFADGYAKKHKRRVGLIPCADGGTKIMQWQPGEALYDHALFCARLAMRSSNLKAILFHQGESDCTPDGIAAYGERLLRVVEGLRRDLGMPRLPFIAGELSECISERWYNCTLHSPAFNVNLHTLASEIDNFAIASAEGLTMKPDGIHFDTPSLRIFGERYLEKYEDLLK